MAKYKQVKRGHMRVSRQQLGMTIKRLELTTGKKFDKNYAYGYGVKLTDESGSVDLSPRMTTRELYDAVHVALNIIEYAKK